MPKPHHMHPDARDQLGTGGSGADPATGNDQCSTGQPTTEEEVSDAATAEVERIDGPEVVIEIVAIGGPEGDHLQALQADAVRNVLMRLAEHSRGDHANRGQGNHDDS